MGSKEDATDSIQSSMTVSSFPKNLTASSMAAIDIGSTNDGTDATQTVPTVTLNRSQVGSLMRPESLTLSDRRLLLLRRIEMAAIVVAL